MAGRKKEAEIVEGAEVEAVVESQPVKNENDRVEIIKNGVTRIRARAEIGEYLAQGWKLK